MTGGDFPVPFKHAIVAVDKNGRPIWEQGDIHEVFPLASVTKIITSLSALRAVEEGALDLSTVAGYSPSGQPYTIAHLLSHSSGLAVEGDGNDFRAAPGMRRLYTNQGFEVLGDRVEEAVDRPLAKWMDQQVYQPLGLRNTVVPQSPARSGFGNAMDMTLLGEELLQPQLLDPKTHAALKTTVLPGLRGVLPGYGMQPNNTWGLGVEVKGDKDPHWTPKSASPQTFGHFGMSGSYLWADPKAEVAAVFLGEEPFGDWHKENWPVLGEKIMEAAGR